MADTARLYEALRKADAAGDSAAATRLAQYIRDSQSQPTGAQEASLIPPAEGQTDIASEPNTPQAYAERAISEVAQGGEPTPEDISASNEREAALLRNSRGERGVGGTIADFFTGANNQTPEAQALPEMEGLLQNQGIGQALKVAGLQLITPDDNEMASILKQANHNLEFSRDAAGNLIGFDPTTGARALVNSPGMSAPDIGQVAAGALAFSPAGRAAGALGGGVARQAAALGAGSALTQAAIEGAQVAGGGEFNAGDVGISGALGAAAPLVGGAIGAGIDSARRGVQALRNPAGSAAPIVQAAERANIPLMTSDIAPPTTPIGQLAQRAGERIPYAGTGGIRATQQEARKEAIRQLGDQYPAPKASQIIDSLKSQTSRIKQAAGQRYQEIVPKIDAVGAVPYTKTTKAIDDAMAELSKPGVVTSREALDELQQFRDTLGSAPQTYSTLKENRTALRDVVSSYDSLGRSQLPTRAKALLNKVYGAISTDMDDVARSTLSPRDFGRLKEANAIYASEAEKLTKTRLKNVLDKGDLTPEVAENLLFSAKRSEVKSLYDSLDTTGRDAVRASIVQRAITKAGGVDDVSPEKFISEMRRLQNQTGVAFKGEQGRQLEGLKEVLAATRRAGQTGITNTGQEAFVPLTAAAAGSAIGSFGGTLAAGATAGALARAYESPLMRNALIRIGSAPKSQASKQMALRLARELNAGIQSARAQDTEAPPQQ